MEWAFGFRGAMRCSVCVCVCVCVMRVCAYGDGLVGQVAWNRYELA